MATIFFILFLLIVGFITGYRYAHKLIMEDVKQVVDEVLNPRRRRG